MVFSQVSNWSFAALPATCLVITDESRFIMMRLLLVFGVVSCGYLLLSWLVSRMFPARRKGIAGWLFGFYTISLMLACFAVSARAKGAVYVPLFQGVALLLLNAGFLVALCGNWFIHRKEALAPLPMLVRVRAGYWFSLLTNSLLWLVIFLQVPVVSPEKNIIFWVPPPLALLLYFGLTYLLFDHAHTWFGLRCDPEQLPTPLKNRFDTLNKLVTDQGPYQLVLLGRGIRNAVALYTRKRVLLGVELLEHLNEQEITGVILHEIGHLKDTRYLRYLHLLHLLIPFVMVGFVVLSQGRIFTSPGVEFAVLIVGLIVFSTVMKRLRLKGEFVADSFVKAFPGGYHPYLLTGLATMTRLNGMDKDFCKKYDHGHLDLDEREEMVARGRFSISRKPVRRFFLVFIPFLLLGVGLQIGWSYLFPSAGSRWGTMHSRYHDQYRSQQYDEAQETVAELLDFSVKKFGEYSRYTYISLNDLANISMRQQHLDMAERYVVRAGAAGKQLFGQESLRRIRDRKILARIRIKQQRPDEAEALYRQILNTQQQLGDKPEKITSTLYSLADILEHSGRRQELVKVYEAIISQYKSCVPADGDCPSADIFPTLADVHVGDGFPEKGEVVMVDAEKTVRLKKGMASEEYGNIIWDLASYYRNEKKYAQAQRIYEQCLGLAGQIEEYIFIGCRYGLAENYRLQNMAARAEKEINLALSREEELYGENSRELIYGLQQLAILAEDRGDHAQADIYNQRAEQLEATGE